MALEVSQKKLAEKFKRSQITDKETDESRDIFII